MPGGVRNCGARTKEGRISGAECHKADRRLCHITPKTRRLPASRRKRAFLFSRHGRCSANKKRPIRETHPREPNSCRQPNASRLNTRNPARSFRRRFISGRGPGRSGHLDHRPRANILFANEASPGSPATPRARWWATTSRCSQPHRPREIYQSMWTALMEQRPWSGKLLNRRAASCTEPADHLAGGGRRRQDHPTTWACTGTSPSSTGSSRWCATKALIRSVVDAAPRSPSPSSTRRAGCCWTTRPTKLVTDLRVAEPATPCSTACWAPGAPSSPTTSPPASSRTAKPGWTTATAGPAGCR